MSIPDIPIFNAVYALYKALHHYRETVSKQDRYTVYRRCENVTLDIIEHILLAAQQSQEEKRPTLEQASVKLNFLRVLVRLLKDTKALDLKRYAELEHSIDEIGRMLGGWIRSLNSNT